VFRFFVSDVINEVGSWPTSYYCVILKLVILQDAIRIIQNGVFEFFIKKE